ncbi:hypothetical protein EV363DRAFT_1183119 [Boletus edulis]|nr:hypothetical protein EV363DRAFT_1183119 [Boletus edulis]
MRSCRLPVHSHRCVSTSAVLLSVVCYLQRSSRPLKRSCATSSPNTQRMRSCRLPVHSHCCVSTSEERNSVTTVSPTSCGAVSS